MMSRTEFFIFLLVLLLALLSLYLLFILPTQWLKIERIKLPLGLQRKLLQISDLHVERLRISPAQIQRLISSEQPDLIVLTGDFLDTPQALFKLKRYLRVLSPTQTRIPCFAVLGNHDYMLPNIQPLVDLLGYYEIRVLRNEALDLGDFILLGIDDYDTRHHNPEQAYQYCPPEKKRIVLQHDPNYILVNTHLFDYLLSGHLHGKQFNIPFLFHLKDMGPLPRLGIYKGLQYAAQGPYYISKGVGQSGINARLFVRSEVTVHEI